MRDGGSTTRNLGRAFPGLDDAVYAQIRAHPEFRVAVDTMGPHPTHLRHYGLRTPQGFDPMLPAQYSEKLSEFIRPSDNRMLDFDAECEDLLRLFGVRYYITSEGGSMSKSLAANEHWKLLEPPTSYFKAYELRNPQPSFYWAAGGSNDATIRGTRWEPAIREFSVQSPQGGRFVLAEQYYPGWRASIDGVETAITRQDQVLQAIEVPAGPHTLQFKFRSAGLIPGAIFSLAGLAVLCIGALWKLAVQQDAGLYSTPRPGSPSQRPHQ